MALQIITQLQQSAGVLPGTWKLGEGRAVTLTPQEAGILRVAHGSLWATLDGPHQGALNDLGDCVLRIGQELRLRPGQRVVVEPWSGTAPAYFTWDPLLSAAAAHAPRPVASVAEPLAQLRLALVLGAGALGRLAAGVAGMALAAVLGRRSARGTAGMARACASHGAMG